MEPKSTDARILQLGRNVQSLREQAGMTQTELARRAGISRTSLHVLERGSGNPRLDTMLAIADTLGIGVHLMIPRG